MFVSSGDRRVDERVCFPRMRGMRIGMAAAWLAVAPAVSPGQQTEYRMAEGGRWEAGRSAEPGTEEETIARARRLLAEDRPGEARALLDAWIEEHRVGQSPWLPTAYRLRGDAKLAMDEEYRALVDYETVIKEFPESPEFVTALEREFEIARRYLNGLRKRFLGMRIEDATPIGEDLMLRIAERLPSSQLAEEAVLELADWYYRTRDLRAAAETYDVFLELFPRSERRMHAYQRRILANVARFKGPEYDASGLREAGIRIREFRERYPAEAVRSGLGDALAARLEESAAAQMLSTARWYLRRRDRASARLVLERLTASHPGTVSADKALAIMVEEGWVRPAGEGEGR